jgi:hypothetical protein
MLKVLQLLSANRRMLKTVLAAGISWSLADELIGSPHPYLAPMAAVVVRRLPWRKRSGTASGESPASLSACCWRSP